MKHLLSVTSILCLSAVLLASCSKEEQQEAPLISFQDNPTGVFGAKAGSALVITPSVENGVGARYEWKLDGQSVGSQASYTFQSNTQAVYSLSVSVTTPGGEDTKTITVTVGDGTFYRPVKSGDKAACSRVYEYTPAPGQFINEKLSGFTGESTPSAACTYALQRINQMRYVSLGGFGGYIVVGFDHSLYNMNGYDFAVLGNSFASNSEPGIVYVMQDENGNGQPDDTWYELKGSETGHTETIQNYAVTYTKPSGPGEEIHWTDDRGGSGTIAYMPTFHTQESYYPAWITSDSYTLSGTRLAPRTVWKEGLGWDSQPFEWGYADNFSSKDGTGNNPDGTGARINSFNIDNAIRADGTPVHLPYIDFVKVQTGVNFGTAATGEISTEVLGIKDLNAGK